MSCQSVVANSRKLNGDSLEPTMRVAREMPIRIRGGTAAG